MLFDFIQFLAQYIIACTIVKLAQAKFANTQWGPALAFIG